MYEVVSISGHYVLHNSERSLWCSKIDAGIIPSSPTILDESLDPVCLGTCYGIVGKIQFLPESPENLILITEREEVCNLFGAMVYRVKDVVVLPLSLETPYLDLPKCAHHGKPPRGEDVSDSDTKLERKLEDEFVKWFEKSFYYSEITDITHTTLERAEKRYAKGMPLWRKVKEEYFWNRTMLECLIENSDENSDAWILPLMQVCFYPGYSIHPPCLPSAYLPDAGDLADLSGSTPEWSRTIAHRLASLFNIHFLYGGAIHHLVLNSALRLGRQRQTVHFCSWLLLLSASCLALLSRFIAPISVMDLIEAADFTRYHKLHAQTMNICHNCKLHRTGVQWYDSTRGLTLKDRPDPRRQGYIERKEVSKDVTLTLVSRRNKYRAGFRFKRRGIDDKGHVANFVITEQILRVGRREFALELVRGSVPVFWYQPLTNYRPKPVITSPREESLEAFKIHMDPLITRYEKVVVVNLLDSEGKESCLGDERTCTTMNISPTLHLISTNTVLGCGLKLNELTGITNNYSFTELVDGCLMGEQEGVIRVNCMDSLDRTNVVQGAIAKKSLMTQIEGIPDVPLDDLIQASKLLWANNGDAISTQYAARHPPQSLAIVELERGLDKVSENIMKDCWEIVHSMGGSFRLVQYSRTPFYRDARGKWFCPLILPVNRGSGKSGSDCIIIRKGDLTHMEHLPKWNFSLGSPIYDFQDYFTLECATNRLSTISSPCNYPLDNLNKIVVHMGQVSPIRRGLEDREVLVHEIDSQEVCSLTAVDRLHIGQPPECLGHYLRFQLANKAVTVSVRPLEAGTNMRDALMKMAHAIVSYRDNLNLSTNVVHGPLSKNADLVDMGIDKIKSSANRIAAGAKKMIGGITGDKSSSPEPGDERSPRFGRKMLNMFRREEEGDGTKVLRINKQPSSRRGSSSTWHCTADEIARETLCDVTLHEQFAGAALIGALAPFGQDPFVEEEEGQTDKPTDKLVEDEDKPSRDKKKKSKKKKKEKKKSRFIGEVSYTSCSLRYSYCRYILYCQENPQTLIYGAKLFPPSIPVIRGLTLVPCTFAHLKLDSTAPE
eukprot:sb/3461478/